MSRSTFINNLLARDYQLPASLAAVAQSLHAIPEGATILTFNYDTGERYLSVEGLY